MASHPLDDTIVAVASPPGGGARAIVRLSGPRVVECVERLFAHSSLFTLHSSPFALPGSLSLPGIHSPLPADLYFWPDGRSYTGEPVAEFHTLGSRPLVDAVLRAACAAGARLARPGEFTLRAFLAGRIDLTQAEAVLGVIDATDRRQLDVALEQLAGGLSRPLDELRERLVELLGHLEAGLDFADEELPFITAEQLREQIAAARRAISDLAAQLQSRRRADDDVRVVLIGRPNAGKSSLFNALAQVRHPSIRHGDTENTEKGFERIASRPASQDKASWATSSVIPPSEESPCSPCLRGEAGRAGAIVSHEPGTTRDYLSTEIDLDGVRFQLVDTAGVETARADERAPVDIAADLPGEEAIRRSAEQVARREHDRADVRIHCVAAAEPQSELIDESPVDVVVVFTKADLIEPTEEERRGLFVSSVTGQGLDALRARLRDVVARARSTPDHAVASTAARCEESVAMATAALIRATAIVDTGGGEELVAAEIRVALDAVGSVAGAVHADDVLDRVFSRFCIGK